MKSLIRFVVVVAACLGMLFASAGTASAREIDTDDLVRFGPCPPGTTHRVGPVCFGF